MLKLYKRVEEIVAANQTGPMTYLYPIYTYYFPLVSDQIKKLTERIFEQDVIPALPVSKPKSTVDSRQSPVEHDCYYISITKIRLFQSST